MPPTARRIWCRGAPIGYKSCGSAGSRLRSLQREGCCDDGTSLSYFDSCIYNYTQDIRELGTMRAAPLVAALRLGGAHRLPFIGISAGVGREGGKRAL
jgi:hypothetical protein